MPSRNASAIVSSYSTSEVSSRRSKSSLGMISLGLLVSLVAFVMLAVPIICDAQIETLPTSGLQANVNYQHSDIDSVNLSNGSISVHIPLISYPQAGNKLRMSFLARFNDPIWIVKVSEVGVGPSGQPQVGGQWALQRPIANTVPAIGVLVVRDQGITFSEQDVFFPCLDNNTYVDCTSDPPAPGDTQTGTFTQNYSLRDRTGTEHAIGVLGMSGPTGMQGFLLAPDGSGWLPHVSAAGIPPDYFIDRDGVKYTPNNSFNYAAWNVSDAHGNMITTTANGWMDSVGRLIPGSWTGPGALNQGSSYAGATNYEDDPTPGVPTSDLSKCGPGDNAARLWSLPGMQGSPNMDYWFCYADVNYSTNFQGTTPGFPGVTKGMYGVQMYGGAAYLNEASGVQQMLTRIVLPNNTSYAFSYDSYLELSQITFPQGGTVTYTWESLPWDTSCASGVPAKRFVKSRTVDSVNGSPSGTWTYNWQSIGGCVSVGVPFEPSVAIARPDGNSEVHFEGDVRYYTGAPPANWPSNLGNPTKIISTVRAQLQSPFFVPYPLTPNGDGTYSGGGAYQESFPGPVISTTTTLDDGTTSIVSSTMVPSGTAQWADPSQNLTYRQIPSRQYGTCLCINYNLIQSTSEYDYGNASNPIRTTTKTFKWMDGSGNASNYATANLLDLPSKVVTTGWDGTVREVDYSYDENSYSAGVTAGELTTTSQPSQTATVTTHSAFNSQGEKTEAVDANGNVTFVNSFECSGTLPHQVTLAYSTPLAESVTYTHDCQTGKIVAYSDVNSQITKYTYDDPLLRLTLVNYPDGGSTSTTYTDTQTPSVKIAVATGSDPETWRVLYDGLGRTRQTQMMPDAPGTIYQDLTYDAMGRLSKKSNPYLTTSDATYGITVTSYDVLNRISQVTDADGTSTSIYEYTGADTKACDEVGHCRTMTKDALGRLTSVNEVPSAVILSTIYSYDGLDNLIKVNQEGANGEAARVRTFAYDPGLARLLTSTNPETGTICYGTWSGGSPGTGTCQSGYDANGNLTYKTDPRGYVSNYAYDALNRLSQVLPVAGGSAEAKIATCYQYDQLIGASSGNLIGRLTAEWTQTGNQCATPYTPSIKPLTAKLLTSYDATGRPLQSQQCVKNQCQNVLFSQSQLYDLAGNMTSWTDGLGQMTFNQHFDSAGRPMLITNSLSGNGLPQNLFSLSSSQPGYNPAGSLQNWSVGDSYLNFVRSYDNRLRVQTEVVTH